MQNAISPPKDNRRARPSSLRLRYSPRETSPSIETRRNPVPYYFAMFRGGAGRKSGGIFCPRNRNVMGRPVANVWLGPELFRETSLELAAEAEGNLTIFPAQRV